MLEVMEDDDFVLHVVSNEFTCGATRLHHICFGVIAGLKVIASGVPFMRYNVCHKCNKKMSELKRYLPDG